MFDRRTGARAYVNVEACRCKSVVLSSDGSIVACSHEPRGNGGAIVGPRIFSYDRRTGSLLDVRSLANAPPQGTNMRLRGLSADGSTILWAATDYAEERLALFDRTRDTSVPVTSVAARTVDGSLSRSGAYVVFADNGALHAYDRAAQSVRTWPETSPGNTASVTVTGVREARISADGKWIALVGQRCAAACDGAGLHLMSTGLSDP